MTTRRLPLVLLAAASLLPQFTATAQPAGKPPLPKVLFFANPMGSDNDVIRRPTPDVLSIAERYFATLSRNVFDATITQDGTMVTAGQLANYDVVVFFTAINPPGVDVDALVEWVARGGAFVGIHSTANTYQKHAGFGEMLGARYERRPWRTQGNPQTKVKIKVGEKTHPSVKHFPATFPFADDIYLFKGFDGSKVTLLLSLDPKSLDMSNPRLNLADNDLPVAWAKSHGKGRVFYTALGDWEPVWKDPAYVTHLIEGIRWTMQAKR